MKSNFIIPGTYTFQFHYSTYPANNGFQRMSIEEMGAEMSEEDIQSFLCIDSLLKLVPELHLKSNEITVHYGIF